jgi:hypothetical protein
MLLWVTVANVLGWYNTYISIDSAGRWFVVALWAEFLGLMCLGAAANKNSDL